MRPRTTTIPGENSIEINGAVEAQAAVGEDVDPVAFVVTGGVEDGDLVLPRSVF
jgi:hypothetical protein